MSTYLCHARLGRLTQAQKGEIAEAFTRIHNDVTGGPPFFVQVIFRDVGSGDHFIGGAPVAEDQAWIQGEIRAGRTAKQKGELLKNTDAHPGHSVVLRGKPASAAVAYRARR